MSFSRKLIDKDIDFMLSSARAAGTGNEALFLIDVPLREYVVAINQMIAEGGDPSNVCDSSVNLVCSMIINLAGATGVRNPDTFVDFSNKFMYEVSLAMNATLNRANTDPDKEYGVEVFDPNRTNH